MKTERGSRPITGQIREILAEHHECMGLVARLEACLDRHIDLEGVWLSDMREELPRLLNTLREHFRDEETGLLYKVLPVSRPRYAGPLQALEAQHARILTAAERALEHSAELRDPALHELREFNAEIQLLVASIRRHETAENELLLTATWDEVGVGD